MYIVDEKDKDYRFGNSGPKYLMRGPRMNFALVRLLPGQDFSAHYHSIMEEDFYVLSGEVDITVDDTVSHLTAGQFIHCEPGEVHYLVNRGSEPVQLVATLAPYQEQDKTEVPDFAGADTTL